MIHRLLERLFGKTVLAATPQAHDDDRPLPYVTSRDRALDLIGKVAQSDSFELIEACLCDYSGYLREAALVRAAELGNPVLLPMVAERLNDWVDQVRDAARTTVLSLLDKLEPDVDTDMAMQLLVQVQRLREMRRSDHFDWIARFEVRFIARIGEQRIVAAIGSDQSRVALACFRLAHGHDLGSPAILCQQALANKHHFALVHSAIGHVRTLAEPDRLALYRQALVSPVGMARAEALRGLLASGIDDATLLASSMLVDGNGWVRTIASNYLARHGIDVAATYAQHLRKERADGRLLRASLAGLAENKGAAYLDLVRQHAAHPLARVQVAAFQAWITLSPTEKDAIALRVLQSPHRRVRHLYLHFATKLGAHVPPAIALPIARAHRDIDQMLTITRSNQWTLLETIATIAGDAGDDRNTRGKLRIALMQWLHAPYRDYLLVDSAQRAFLRQDTVKRLLVDLLDPAHYAFDRYERDLVDTLRSL